MILAALLPIDEGPSAQPPHESAAQSGYHALITDLQANAVAESAPESTHQPHQPRGKH